VPSFFWIRQRNQALAFPGGGTMKITRKSLITGKTHTRDLPITEAQLAAYESGVLVQDAFPHLSPPEREFIKTGITPEEWQAEVVGVAEEEEETVGTTPKMPKTLTDQDFKAIADLCFIMADKALKKLPAGHMLPPLVLMGSISNGQNYGEIAIHHTFIPPLDDAQDREILTHVMDTLVQSTDMDFAVFIGESWMVAQPDHMPVTESIANLPERQEAVVFSIMSKDSQVVVANPLHRNPLRLERGEMGMTIGDGRMVRQKPPVN
jgi:hypothetical protein